VCVCVCVCVWCVCVCVCVCVCDCCCRVLCMELSARVIFINLPHCLMFHHASPGQRAVKRVCVCMYMLIVTSWHAAVICHCLHVASCRDTTVMFKPPIHWPVECILPPITWNCLVPSVRQKMMHCWLTLLYGHREEHLVYKNWAMRCWHGYLNRIRCRRFAYCPADATAFPKPHHPYDRHMVH